jgi:peptidoglycan/LPS O-acetylase OafA/YrhL
MKTTSTEIPQIVFLRFAAALGVVIFHFGTRVPSLSWGRPLWNIANTGVSFFFFLSGFILSYVYSERGIRRPTDFYVARLARIYPIYFLALISVTLVNHRVVWTEFWLSALLIQAWVPTYSQVLNTPAWALSVQVLFYLVFPFVLPVLQRIRSGSAIAGIMGLLWLANLLIHIVLVGQILPGSASVALKDFTFYHPLTHLPTFFEGICGGLLFLRYRRAIAPFGVALALVAMTVGIVLIYSSNPVQKYHHNGLFVPVFFGVVAGLSSATGSLLARALSVRPLRLLGDISFSMYILQAPISLYVDKLARAVGWTLSYQQRFWLLVFTIIGVSYVVYRFVETPLRKRLNRRGREVQTEPVSLCETAEPTSGILL